MSPPSPRPLDGRRIVVADEDPSMVAFVMSALHADGHAVFEAHDALAAAQLALGMETCHLVISDTRVKGKAGTDLIHQLRERLPTLPVLFVASIGRSTPEIESQLPSDVPILREPFTASGLRTVVDRLLDGNGDGRPTVERDER
jgi:DNA-binding response OmpR family regulator